ncbi:MAG: hypothetical protein ABIT01_04325, partial [Thermoanaerobaculia bacterium]
FTFSLLLSDLEPLRDRDARKAELFYAAVAAEWRRDGWGGRAELRGKDGRFRPYFAGDVWLQSGYGFYETSVGEIRLGKIERSFGLEDPSFGGTLFSFNGITRNPEWGAELAGSRRMGWNVLDWSLRYIGRNDRVAWEEDGRGVESDPDATVRDGLEARVTYLANQGLTSLKPGISFSTARIVRETSGPPGSSEFRRTDVAVDLTGSLGPLSAGVEAFFREGETTDGAGTRSLRNRGAWAGLLVIRAEFPNVSYRYIYSEWRYRGADSNEREHQLAASWSPKRGIEGTLELSARRLREAGDVRVFNAVRFGLVLAF